MNKYKIYKLKMKDYKNLQNRMTLKSKMYKLNRLND